MSEIVPLLVARTGLRERDIRMIVLNAPSRYKSYLIEKRTGGQRLISQPAKELKTIQRILLQAKLNSLPVHSAATAYRANQSIRDNAYAHIRNGSILKLDFRNFFPSIVPRDWRYYCKVNSLFKYDEDIDISTNILFHRPKGTSSMRLAIGAPTSPHLSNVLMYEFDNSVYTALSDENIVYTRYADDITLSAPRAWYLKDSERLIRKIMKEIASPSLSFNKDKRVFATKKFKRMVTGLVISNDDRVTIGRRRKHELRAQMQYALLGKLSDAELAGLSGMLAFVSDVEPDWFEAVKSRYGISLIEMIKKHSGEKKE